MREFKSTVTSVNGVQHREAVDAHRSFPAQGDPRVSGQHQDPCIERRENWVGQGVRLEIVATSSPDGLWTLSVINERGIMSTWNESFATAEVAIGVARKAIEEEGVEEFVSIEGFEYLDDWA
jgi:hypothetical protein